MKAEPILEFRSALKKELILGSMVGFEVGADFGFMVSFEGEADFGFMVGFEVGADFGIYGLI